MKNITKYASKSVSKEEITFIYVHEIDDRKYAVATDIFRLARIEIPSPLDDIINNGFYDVSSWGKITKAVNKKITDFKSIISEVKTQDVLQEDRQFKYPEYQLIVPKPEDLEEFKTNVLLNSTYFYDFTELIKDKYNIFDFNDIKQSTKGGALIYQSEELLLMLMPAKK